MTIPCGRINDRDVTLAEVIAARVAEELADEWVILDA